jgi:plastocyanin
VKNNLASAVLMAALVAPPALGTETPEYTIRIENHRFKPSEISVPAGQKLKLLIDNRDATPEEFESHDLGREKVIAGGAQATIWVGPLEPGIYTFVGEYHEPSAKGWLIVR